MIAGGAGIGEETASAACQLPVSAPISTSSALVVAAGQVAVRLAQEGPREAAVSLPEGMRPAIGSTATAANEGAANGAAARLRQFSDSADPRTRTFDARYVLTGAAAQAPLGTPSPLH